MKQFKIDESERQRILNLHESATKRQYLNIVLTESASKLRSNLPSGVVEKGSEIDSGGEISNELSDIAIELFNELVSNGVNGITITSGNDSYHQNISTYKSKHTEGNALDFTVPNYSSQKGIINKVLNDLKSKYPKLNFIDEYANPSKKSTGGHFHIQIGAMGGNKDMSKSGNKNTSEVSSNIKTISDLLNNIKNIQGEIKKVDQKNMVFKQSVELIQTSLELLGYPLPRYGVDGKFHNETEKVLNDFKRDNGLQQDGIFDEQTKNTMYQKLIDSDITDEDLKKYLYPSKEFSSLDGNITHNYSGIASKNIQRLIDIMNKYGVTDPIAQVGMLSVIGKETKFINRKEKGYEETPNERIQSIFSKTKNLSDEQLDGLKRDYSKFFNFVYNDKMGNNNPNDGSKYVGRGFNQLTGKNNYERYSKIVGVDLVANPDVLLDNDIASEVAVKFLMSRGVPQFNNPVEASKYFADINAGGTSKSARENSLRELQNFDIVEENV